MIHKNTLLIFIFLAYCNTYNETEKHLTQFFFPELTIQKNYLFLIISEYLG